MAFYGSSAITVECPTAEAWGNRATPEPNSINLASRILKIASAGSHLFDHSLSQIGPFLKSPVVISSNQDFILSGLAFQPHQETSKSAFICVIHTISAMN